MYPAEVYTNAQRSEICRRYVETLELWLRRIVHDEMAKKHGDDYFRDGVVSSNIRKTIESRVLQNPSRYLRKIDATSLDDIVKIIVKPENFKEIFKDPFMGCYPGGPIEASTFLNRIVDIRNSVDHSNGCSQRQLEQIVCYSNDIIESIQRYYIMINKAQLYNAPNIIRFSDSMGNIIHSSQTLKSATGQLYSLTDAHCRDLHVGQNILFEVEVDPTYKSDNIEYSWNIGTNRFKSSGETIAVIIKESDVSMRFHVKIRIKSSKNWHRHGSYDDSLAVFYRVLPPIT